MFLFKAVEVLKRLKNTSEITFDFFLVVILVASVLLVPRVSASGQWSKSPGATAHGGPNQVRKVPILVHRW